MWSLAACAPGKFDELVKNDAPGAPSDASVVDANVIDAGGFDAGEVTRDARVSSEDASADAGAPMVEPSDGGTPDPEDMPSPVDSGCPRDGVLAVGKPVVELARMEASPLFGTRVLGPTVRLGVTDHVWIFSNALQRDASAPPAGTPSNHPFISFDGNVQPWNRPVNGPWFLKRSTSEAQLPPTMLPLRAGEGAGVSLVPTSLTRAGTDTHSELFLVQYDDFAMGKVWRATIQDGSERAERNAQPLFSAPPLFAVAARIDGPDLNVYACSGDMAGRCYAGRVPYVDRDDASKYQVRVRSEAGVWSWTNNLQNGTPVLEGVSQNDLTISFNSYLNGFLAVYGEPLTNNIVLRKAGSPYGPWSEPVRVPLPAPRAFTVRGIREHPSLAQNCERRVIVSYFAPTTDANYFTPDGDVVMAAIDFD